MDERLQESEQRHRLLFEASTDCITQLDREGRYLVANPATARSLGVPLEGLVGKTMFDVMPKEVAQRRLADLTEVMDKWQPRVFEDERAGRYFHHTVIPLKTSDHEEAVQVITRDITESKQAAEKLRQSEENYRALFDSSVIGTFVLDAETMRVVIGNQAAAKAFGFSSAEETVGVNPLDFVPAEDREKNLELIMKEVFEKNSRGSIDLPVMTKDGRRIWVSVTGARIMHKGRLAGLFSFTDITEHKQAEEALRQSEERYRTILEEMEDAYFEVDLGGHLTFVNNAVCRDLGYSRDELIGMSYKAFTVEDDVNSVFGVFSEVYRTGVPNKGSPWRTIRKDGTRGFAETSISPLRNDRGEIIGFRGVGRDITERKKAEEAANLQKAYFQQLFDNSPDAILMMDTNDKAIQANRAFETLFGYSNEEVKDRSLAELVVPEEDTQEAYDSLHRILGGAVVRKERVRRRKDGSLVDVSVLAYPIRSNGRLVGAYGIYTDITERKKQEQALADELTRRRLLIDQSLDGIVVLDVDARVVEANQRFADMLGYTLKEVHELHTWDWDKNFPPERILEMGRNADEKGFRLETKHTRKDGFAIDVDISINAAMCAGQKLIFCVCRDVTTRKKMAEAVKQAAEEWSTTIDSISDAVSIHDKDFRILRANKAFADLFRKSLNEIIGIHCYELHKGNEPKPGCPHQHTLTTGKPASAEFYESHMGKHLLESTSPIFNEQGETVGTVHITRDITEQKRQNERLLMADRLASLGELAAGTAHELNNPLTSIIGFSQLLMEKEVPEDIHEDLKLINNEAQRAANVTRNLLAFARKYAPVKQLNEINSIIEDVLELRAYEQRINSIDVERHLAPDLPKVMVDYFQMQQVFMNIIINAEYFMTDAHNGGTLRITTKKHNGAVMIAVADDGPGIAQEDLGRIFDPFFTTKPPGKGTGLGLSICHGIVTEHGGQISVKSQLGRGATFIVELPIKGRGRYRSVT
jgi:PAS domain S-box-containing protein